jgi:hypothetical protein
MIDREFRELVDKSLNDIATDDEIQALGECLLNDVEARDHYINATNVHASLKRRYSVVQESSIIAPFPSVVRRKVAIGAAIAAGLAVLIAVSSILLNPASPPAVIAQVVGAYGEAETAYAVGETVESGPLVVSRGLMRLDFSNGARVTIEGPARVELIDEMQMVLHHGVLTAAIPEAAIGFVVDTSAVHVVDLGTSFGVSVGEDGQTQVCVFDGEVEVSSQNTSRSEVKPRMVKEGQAIRVSKDSKTINSVAFETSQFENTWPINYGVLQTTGSMRFVSPGPNFHPGNYEDNEHIVVFPEKRDFKASESIRVDMIDPGEYEKSLYREKPSLTPGKALTSYLLQLDAYPEGKNPNRRRSVRGQITFAKPIVGVVTADRLLKDSEAVFGIPGVDYPTARTIEPRPEGDLRPGFDSLILTADRHSLILELRENPGHLDQVRVLVEAN